MFDAPEPFWLDRDEEFWGGLAEACSDIPHAVSASEVGSYVQSERVLPFRSSKVGFLFVNLDGLGRIYDLHAISEPSRQRNEAFGLLAWSLQRLFGSGVQMITVQEVEVNRASRPPRSFGFRPAGPFSMGPLGVMRTWFLVQDMWTASPVYRRMFRCLQSS